MKVAMSAMVKLVQSIEDRVEQVERKTTETDLDLKVAFSSPSGPMVSLVTTVNAIDTRLSSFMASHRNDVLAVGTSSFHNDNLFKIDDLAKSVKELRS